MNVLLEATGRLVLLDPWMLLLGILLPVALIVRLRRGRPALWFAPTSLLHDRAETTGSSPLPRTLRQRLTVLPPALGMIGLALLVVALARPARRVPLPLEIEGIDIVLCLDTSSSMTATDLEQGRSRLEVATRTARQFVAGRPHDAVGLVSFARYPDLLCPPTLDHAALGEILAAVRPVEADGPEDATGIGTAVARAAQVLRGSKARSRVVILLTDGEENVATTGHADEIAPIHAAQLCRELGVRVDTIAAGSGRLDRQGRWTPIDTGPVRQLAEMTGGTFHEARDARAMEAVYARIDALERTEQAEPRTRTIDGYELFLAAGLILLVGGHLLAGLGLEAMP